MVVIIYDTHVSDCVTDKEAPQVTHCSADISVMLSINDMRTSVSWEEPMFTDNTGIVDIKQTHMSGK